MFLAVDSSTLMYALLEGRELVEINTTSAITCIGFSIQKEINKLDKQTMYLLAKYFDTEKHITIGDKKGFYHTPFGQSNWQYVETK